MMLMFNNISNIWIAHEPDESLDFNGILIPPKKRDLVAAENACKANMPSISHPEYLDDEQIEAHKKARTVLINSCKKFHSEAPDDIRKILYVFNGLMNRKEGVYILETSTTSFKAGESHNCQQRVIEQQEGRDKVKFVLMPPKQFIPSGLIGKDTIESILESWNYAYRCSMVLMKTGVICWKARSCDRWLNFLSPVAIHSEQVLYVSNVFAEGTEIRHWIVKNMSNVKKVYDIDTWPTLDNYLRRPEFSDISNFLVDKSPNSFRTGHLCRMNVGKEKYDGFGDFTEVCPHYLSNLPHVEEMKRLFTEGSPSYDDVLQILAKISPKEYEYPDEETYPQDTQRRVSQALEVRDVSTLIRVRTDIMNRVRDTPWYKSTFIESKAVTGQMVKQKVGGAEGEVEITEGTIMRIHLTNTTCHIVLERSSHFLMLAATESLRKLNCLNAIHNYLVELVLLENIHVLSSEGLTNVRDVMLTMTMILNGPMKTLEQNVSCNMMEVSSFTLPAGVSDGDSLPGMNFIKPPFQVGNRVIPYRAILLMLHVMQEIDFNNLLKILGSKHVIKSRKGKYYLMVGGSKMYHHHHHNFYTGEMCSNMALESIHTINKTTLQAVYTFLQKLYEGIGESNDVSLSMSYRFNLARQELLATHSGEFIDTHDLYEEHDQFHRLCIFMEYAAELEQLKSNQINMYNNVWWIGSWRNSESGHWNAYIYFNRLRQENDLLTDKLKEELVALGFGYLGDKDEYANTAEMVHQVYLERESRGMSSMLAGLLEQCGAEEYEYTDESD